jgi:hypothetical protein
MRRFGFAIPLFLFLLLGSVTLSSADGPKGLNAHVVGSTPNVTIRSVMSGPAPWVVQEGKATVDLNGNVKIRAKGLLIGSGVLASGAPVPADLVGTVGPVTSVHAALTCGGAGGAPFAIINTPTVPLSPQGSFKINAHITLPTTCDRPIILIRAFAPEVGGPFIALAEPFFEREDDDD